LLNLDTNREPAAARDAATVIVIRDGEAGIEAFCVLRHPRSSFLGGAVVFPGGKVDTADTAPGWHDLATAPHPRSAGFISLSADARALAIAACRETLEEAGIVPVDGLVADLDALRAEIAAPPAADVERRGGPSALAASLARRGLRLTLGALVPFARWITPTAEQRRFDARFYLLVLPPGQVGRHDDHETTMSFWGRPRDVLDRFMAGEIFLAPPTTRTLELLERAGTVQGALTLAAEQTLDAICPVFVADDPPYLALPGDPSHEVPERRIAGPTRFVLRDGRFVSGEAPTLPGSPVASPLDVQVSVRRSS
jgi:8-oxo-dGTP pyrophosphatase MutT (NUDIX family)